MCHPAQTLHTLSLTEYEIGTLGDIIAFEIEGAEDNDLGATYLHLLSCIAEKIEGASHASA